MSSLLKPDTVFIKVEGTEVVLTEDDNKDRTPRFTTEGTEIVLD